MAKARIPDGDSDCKPRRMLQPWKRSEDVEEAKAGVRERLSAWRIVEMNAGFFGLQFSFGLQQANMTPIYKLLGADEGTMPLLWLAGPMTGLIIQPIVGALSDRTMSPFGRRTPYFLAGAIVCSLC